MTSRFNLAALFFICCLGVHAQGLDFTDHVDDTTRIESIWDTWSVRLFTQQKSLRFSIIDRNTDTRTRLTPNNRYSVGLGMTYKWISADLGINIRPKGNRRTRRLDLAVTLAFNRNIMTVSFQRYKGFEVQDQEGIIYDFRDDVASYVAGFTFLRAQPDRMLSLKALTSGMNVQKKSTGVFAYGAFWYWDRVSGDSTIVPSELSELYVDRGLADFARQISFGVMGGYAYSLVLPKDFFVFLSAFPGAGLNLGRLESDKKYVTPPFPVLRLSTNGAIGYSGPKIYVIFSINTNWNAVPWGDLTRYHYSDVKFKISVGYRLSSQIPFLENVASLLKASSG